MSLPAGRLSPRPVSHNRTLLWIQRALFTIAFMALGYCAWVIVDSRIFEQREMAELERLVAARRTLIIDKTPANPLVVPARVDGGIGQGRLIGRIEVKRLGLSVVIMEGTDFPILKRAAGHIIGTPLPGEPGNVGIAAHRDTYFRTLKDIRKDDVITVTTPEGDYRYRVVSTRIVDPADVSVLDSDGTDVLTLVTCYPFTFIGPAPNRFIIRAEQIS
jgi:LPXTG-site transpeptidase (sortase) family protein